MEKLLSFIPSKEGTILDVACGKGASTRQLLKSYSPDRVTGINISEKQLERCRVNAPGCRFLLMDATHLTFPDNSFDNVLCVEAAFHFDTRVDFLREAFRVLKPGGRLVLSDLLRNAAGENTPGRTIKNYLPGVEDYGKILEAEGFIIRELIDSTKECWQSFYHHATGALRRKLARKVRGRAALRDRLEDFDRRFRMITCYLLAAAEKPGVG